MKGNQSLVAEPRRQILECLATEEREVGQIAIAPRLEQPSVSKHLKVLRQVGLVRARRNGHGRDKLQQRRHRQASN